MGERFIACVEVGGSGSQTVRFGMRSGSLAIRNGVDAAGADAVGIAVPGIVVGGRVVAASTLRWFDVDPAERLGIEGGAAVVLNDAEAAALGEAALRHGAELTYVSMGTGVGGAVVVEGRIVAGNLFGHARGYSDRRCLCGAVGCLETVAAGWALPHPIAAGTLDAVADAVARAIAAEQSATPSLVVLGGGLVRAYPALIAGIASALTDHGVEPSAAPAGAKSAAAWGLLPKLMSGLQGDASG